MNVLRRDIQGLNLAIPISRKRGETRDAQESPIRNQNGLFVLVCIDALADAILLTVNPVLFRLGKMAVVRCHIFLLALLHTGFALL